MEQHYIIALVWLAGFGLSYWMLKAELEAGKEEYTNGDKTLQVLLSLLSFVMVQLILIRAWASQVKAYWQKPVTRKSTGEKKKPE